MFGNLEHYRVVWKLLRVHASQKQTTVTTRIYPEPGLCYLLYFAVARVVILRTILPIMCQGTVWGQFIWSTCPPFSFRGILANGFVTGRVLGLPGGK